ncbi:NADH pyrophosphatase [Mycobacterium tuberculosis]|nr:NADH pyrophosphatase [Mycobacterium tuberculosis]
MTNVSGVDFQLRSVPLLSRVGADRADRLRTDMEAAAAGWPGAALLRVDSRNRVLVANGRVLLGAAIELADKPPPEAVFLGRVEGGATSGRCGQRCSRSLIPTYQPRRWTFVGSAESWTTPAANWCRRHRRC